MAISIFGVKSSVSANLTKKFVSAVVPGAKTVASSKEAVEAKAVANVVYSTSAALNAVSAIENRVANGTLRASPVSSGDLTPQVVAAIGARLTMMANSQAALARVGQASLNTSVVSTLSSIAKNNNLIRGYSTGAMKSFGSAAIVGQIVAAVASEQIGIIKSATSSASLEAKSVDAGLKSFPDFFLQYIARQVDAIIKRESLLSSRGGSSINPMTVSSMTKLWYSGGERLVEKFLNSPSMRVGEQGFELSQIVQAVSREAIKDLVNSREASTSVSDESWALVERYSDVVSKEFSLSMGGVVESLVKSAKNDLVVWDAKESFRFMQDAARLLESGPEGVKKLRELIDSSKGADVFDSRILGSASSTRLLAKVVAQVQEKLKLEQEKKDAEKSLEKQTQNTPESDAVISTRVLGAPQPSQPAVVSKFVVSPVLKGLIKNIRVRKIA